MGKGLPRVAGVAVEVSEEGRYILATVANGDGGGFENHLLGPSGAWHQITCLADQITHAEFGLDGYLYLLSRQNAPRGKILRLPLQTANLKNARVVVSQSDVVIRSFLPTLSRLYLSDLIGGPSQVRIFDLTGHSQGMVPVPEISTIPELVRHKVDELLFESRSYLESPAWYRFNPSSSDVTRTALYRTPGVDFSDVQVVREFATSKDGTKVPVNIIRRKGTKLDGNNPTILYGYGGYSVSLKPAFSPPLRPLLDRGGVLAIAPLRGGGEYWGC